MVYYAIHLKNTSAVICIIYRTIANHGRFNYNSPMKKKISNIKRLIFA